MNRKKTKIVATISDKKCDVEFLRKLYDAGMDVVRINTAHQSPEDSIKVSIMLETHFNLQKNLSQTFWLLILLSKNLDYLKTLR